jgi:hypothetical protein
MVNGSGPMRRAGPIGPIGKFPVRSPSALMPMPSPQLCTRVRKTRIAHSTGASTVPVHAASADKANMPATARRSRLPQDRSAHLSIQAHAPPSTPMRRLLNDTNGTKGRAHGTERAQARAVSPSSGSGRRHAPANRLDLFNARAVATCALTAAMPPRANSPALAPTSCRSAHQVRPSQYTSNAGFLTPPGC